MDSPVILDTAPEFAQYMDHAFPGFPFDDEGFGRRSDIRSHLDDLAARHPEFADHLLGPPWGDTPFHGTLRNRRRGSGAGSFQGNPDDDARSQASGSSAASAASGASGVSSQGDPEGHQHPETRRNPIPQYGLRNTVDIGQHRHNMENPDKMNRGQRSMSAPPENRQAPYQQQQYQPQPQFPMPQQPQSPNQRFVSRVEITPQPPQQGDNSKPPMSPKQQQSPQPQQSQPQPQQKPQQRPQQQSNVRHIPIFVEGRDEPVIPRNVEEPAFVQRPQSPPQFQAPPQFQRPSHFNQQQFGNKPQQWPPHFQQQFYQQQPQFEQQPAQPSQPQRPPQQQQPSNHYQQQQQQYRQQQAEKLRAHQQQQQQPSSQQEEPEQPRPKQTLPKDPLERVALVQQEVDSLKEQVMKYTGDSRQAKDYMYLDEMLTRELIKLDDIETEGKENVRQARKNTIKSIQNCISLLESKVPLPGQEQDVPEEEKSMETETVQEVVPANGAPIPLPPAPSSPANDIVRASTENAQPGESAQHNEQRTQPPVEQAAQEPMATDCVPLSKVASVTAMEVQPAAEAPKPQEQMTDGPQNQAEPERNPNQPEEASAQKMDVEKPKAPTSPKKGRKTKKQTPVSEEAIPLPAPEAVQAPAK